MEVKKKESEWKDEYLKKKIRLEVLINDYTAPVQEERERDGSRSRDETEKSKGRTTLAPLDQKKFDGSSA